MNSETDTETDNFVNAKRYQEVYLEDKEEEINMFNSIDYLYRTFDILKKNSVFVCGLLKPCSCYKPCCECSSENYHQITSVKFDDLSNCLFMCNFDTNDDIEYLKKIFVRFFTLDDNDVETNILDVVFHRKRKNNYVKFYYINSIGLDNPFKSVKYKINDLTIKKNSIEFQFNYMMFNIIAQ